MCVDSEEYTQHPSRVGDARTHMILRAKIQHACIQSLCWCAHVCAHAITNFPSRPVGHKSDGRPANGHYCSSDWRVVNVCPFPRSCQYTVSGTCRISFEILSHHFALENKNQLLLMVKLFTINTKIKCKQFELVIQTFDTMT